MSEQRCVNCGHNNVDHHGFCKYEIPHPKALYGNYPKRYCGCKCSFSKASEDSAAGEEHPYHVHVRNCESCSGPYGHCTEGLRLLNAPAASEGVPERLFVQVLKNSVAAYTLDPREVHDNGKPVYEYVRVSPVTVGRPCSPCGDGDTAQQFHTHDASPSVDEVALRIAQKVVFFKSGGDPAQDVLPLAEIISTELKNSDSGSRE